MATKVEEAHHHHQHHPEAWKDVGQGVRQQQQVEAAWMVQQNQAAWEAHQTVTQKEVHEVWSLAPEAWACWGVLGACRHQGLLKAVF